MTPEEQLAHLLGYYCVPAAILVLVFIAIACVLTSIVDAADDFFLPVFRVIGFLAILGVLVLGVWVGAQFF